MTMAKIYAGKLTKNVGYWSGNIISIELMILIKKYHILVFVSILIWIQISCTKNNSTKKSIQQSIKVIEDNVNGRVPPPDNIEEVTNFFYNENGLLSSATIYSDTTVTSDLLKEIEVTYLEDHVVVNTFLDTVGISNYKIYFNDKKQVTSIEFSSTNGLHISYFNDRISNIKVIPGTGEYINFLYDENDNLLQYESMNDSAIFMKTILQYNNDLVHAEFDSRFLSKEIKFLYIGGLDLLGKLGLNAGLYSKNKLIKRTEIQIPSGQIYEMYDYGYTHDIESLITKRNVRWSTDTLFYRFKY